MTELDNGRKRVLRDPLPPCSGQEVLGFPGTLSPETSAFNTHTFRPVTLLGLERQGLRWTVQGLRAQRL